MVEGKRRNVSGVAASHAPTAFLLNKKLPSFSSALLLRGIILMLVVRIGVLTGTRAESRLAASKLYLTKDASSFHRNLKVGCKHIT
jgi:hypothetical protein